MHPSPEIQEEPSYKTEPYRLSAEAQDIYCPLRTTKTTNLNLNLLYYTHHVEQAMWDFSVPCFLFLSFVTPHYLLSQSPERFEQRMNLGLLT